MKTLWPLFVLGLAWSMAANADQGGIVRGSAVDASGGAIPGASIRLMHPDTRVTAYRSVAAHDGAFRLADVKPGKYMVAIGDQGFRERFIEGVTVEKGVEVNIGILKLDFAGCDAPGVFCDTFSDKPLRPKPLSEGDIKLLHACTADLEKGDRTCTITLDGPEPLSPLGDRVSDFWVQEPDDKRVYFVPRNKARLAEPNFEGDCRRALYRKNRVRVDGLGPGSDLCIRTRHGHVSHVFFTSEVQAGGSMTIHYVTDK